MAELVLTRHGRFAVERRRISRRVLRLAVFNPARVEPGRRQGVERRIALVDGQEIVAVVALERRYLRLLTAYRTGDEPPAD